MRLLLDQDVYAATARFLASLGHDVVRAFQIGLSHAADEDLLKEAENQNRVLITRDRDFGTLVFVKGLGAGVIYLRLLPSTQNSVHDELEKVLQVYPEQELKNSFIVIEPDGHRIRRLPVK